MPGKDRLALSTVFCHGFVASYIPLSKEKLPSSIGGLAVPDIPTEDLVFFDPIELFRRILSSLIWWRLHRGMTKFTDTPRELWEADGWASSVRTTCGEYAHIPGTDEPIFPSDWIRWQTTEGQLIYLWNVLRALAKPNGITSHSNKPKRVRNRIRSQS